MIACSSEYSGSTKTINPDGYIASCDVWSLGITAIEIAEGYPPHLSDKSPMAAMVAIVRSKPPQLSVVGTSWTRSFRSFVSKCLQKNPTSRPTISEVRCHARWHMHCDAAYFYWWSDRADSCPSTRIHETSRSIARYN